MTRAGRWLWCGVLCAEATWAVEVEHEAVGGEWLRGQASTDGGQGTRGGERSPGYRGRVSADSRAWRAAAGCRRRTLMATEVSRWWGPGIGCGGRGRGMAGVVEKCAQWGTVQGYCGSRYFSSGLYPFSQGCCFLCLCPLNSGFSDYTMPFLGQSFRQSLSVFSFDRDFSFGGFSHKAHLPWADRFLKGKEKQG